MIESFSNKDQTMLISAVYTLWQNPGICALLHTPSMVVNKLRGGADLMTPGLAGPPFPPHAKKGAVVAVASLESPSVPVVIGRCAIDVSSLTTTQGAKGHAVETFHWAGDDLWNWSTSGRPGATAPEECAGWVPDDSEELAAATQKASLEDGRDVEEEGGVSLLGEEDKFKSDFDRNGYVSGEDPTAEQTQDKGGTMATHGNWVSEVISLLRLITLQKLTTPFEKPSCMVFTNKSRRTGQTQSMGLRSRCFSLSSCRRLFFPSSQSSHQNRHSI